MRIEEIAFNADGLVPAVLVDNVTGDVLMMAWMNRESLQRTLDTKLACFWSRSRKELWTKGETSGNYMHVVSISADCDADTLLVRVNPDGPACHNGTKTCFTQEILAPESAEGSEGETAEEAAWALDSLYELLVDRKKMMPEGSYTSYLFEKGVDKILKKVGEECTEVIIAAKAEDKAETIYELADLAYHAMVLMVEQGIGLEEVKAELAGRHVIDKKVKQEKMTGGNAE